MTNFPLLLTVAVAQE